MIVMVLGGILLAGAFQAQRYFTVGAKREKDKAELQRDILTYCEMVEKDVRMAGYGLPGNGIHCVLTSGDHELMVYSNPQKNQTTLSANVASTGSTVLVADASGASDDGWVCFAATDTFYREIDRVGNCNSGPDTLFLTGTAGVAINLGAAVYPATRIRYRAQKTPERGLYRMRNGLSVRVSQKIDAVEVVPKDPDGNAVAGPFSTVEALTVSLSGEIGTGSNLIVVTESVEANVRNRF